MFDTSRGLPAEDRLAPENHLGQARTPVSSSRQGVGVGVTGPPKSYPVKP